MRAAVLHEFQQPFTVEEVDVAPPGPTDIVVSTEAAAFCVTDVINQRGELGKEPPTILGHSGVGTVEEVGEAVTRVRPGDLVLCGGTPQCDRCEACHRGRPDQCAALFAPAPTVGRTAAGVEVTATAVGAYAETMRIPAIWAFPLTSTLPPTTLSLLGCGITSGLGAVFNIARVTPGSTVAVVGAGHLGLWMVQGAKVAGAARVIVVEPREDRRQLAGSLGATDLVDPAEAPAVDQVKALTRGQGPDFVLEAAGTVEAMADAIRMAKNIGTVVLTGVETASSQVTVPALDLAIRGKDIRQCQNGRVRMGRDLPRIIEMLESGTVTADPIISGRYPLEDINTVAQHSWERSELTAVLVPSGRPA